MHQLIRKKKLDDEIYRSGDSDYMVSLARGLHVIQIFCDDGRGQLTIAEITTLSGLSRTVVSRCLYTLQELGFVGRDGRKYYLLPKVLKLGYGYVSAASLPILAQPILDSLTQATDSPSAVVVLEDEDVLYVAKSRPQTVQNQLTLTVNIGLRRPVTLTASGRVLLAGLSPQDLYNFFSNLDVEKRDGPSVSELRTLVAKARREDFAIAKLIFARSMRALAVPVKNVVGETVASMVTAIYDESSADDELIKRYLPLLRKSALKLGEKLID